MCVVNKDFRYVVAEGPVTRAFGLSREKLEGHTIYDVFPAEQSARMEERLGRNFAGETVNYETQYEGRVYWTRQAPLADSLGHAIIVTVDITDRKRVEEALRDSEARMRAILNQATAGIVRKKLDGTLNFVNQAFASMLGYISSELVGKSIWDFTHPDDMPENKRLYDQLMLDGLPFQLEKRLIRRDGSILWANASVSPILDQDGKAQYAVAVEVDITARKRAEEALQQLNLQLESMVEKRTSQLQKANLVLRENRRRLVDVQEDERRAIAREALFNVAKYAQTSTATVSLVWDEKTICLVVWDHGIGMDARQSSSRPGSHGLTIMRERAEAVGGTLGISSQLGAGTRIEANIPLQREGEMETPAGGGN